MHDNLDFSMELDMYDDKLSFDDFTEVENELENVRSSKAKYNADWRRVELVRDNKLLRLALADFEDYDIDRDEGDSGSVYSH